MSISNKKNNFITTNKKRFCFETSDNTVDKIKNMIKSRAHSHNCTLKLLIYKKIPTKRSKFNGKS